MDTEAIAPASSVRTIHIALRLRIPAECPWDEDQIRAALTCNELWLIPTIRIQKYTNGGAALISHEQEIQLPPSFGKFLIGKTSPSLAIPEQMEVARGLTRTGLRLALDKTEVTIPYAFFSITI